MRELELDTLPERHRPGGPGAQAVRLAQRRGAQAYEQIDDLLRREVLDSQFKGMKQALENASPQDLQAGQGHARRPQRDARGRRARRAHAGAVRRLHGEHGELLPVDPETLEELVDDLARRAAAQQRLMDSLTPQQRQELGELMQGAMDLDLPAQLAQLGDSLRNARPDLPWGGASGCAASRAWGWATRRRRSRSWPTSTTSRRRSARTTRRLARRHRRGGRAARARARAVDDVAALRRIERELLEQGYLVATAAAGSSCRRGPCAGSGAPRCARCSRSSRPAAAAGHDVRDAGAAG
jgi:hypothetical protein